MQTKQQQRILIALVVDEPGVLTRIATAFRRRGFNLASLSVNSSEKKEFSRMTFVVEGPPHSLALANHHLERLIEVVEVHDITDCPAITSELALIKVAIKPDTIDEINSIAAQFGAKTVDLGTDVITFEMAGTTETLESIIAQLKKYGILELSRTGRVGTLRSSALDNSKSG